MTTWTWMRNPATGGVQKFADAAVPAWQDAGWEPCDPPTPVNLAVGADHPLLADPADSEPVGGADQQPSNDSADPAPRTKTTSRRSTATETEE